METFKQPRPLDTHATYRLAVEMEDAQVLRIACMDHDDPHLTTALQWLLACRQVAEVALIIHEHYQSRAAIALLDSAAADVPGRNSSPLLRANISLE